MCVRRRQKLICSSQTQANGEVEWNQRVTLKQVTLFWNDEEECYDEKARARFTGTTVRFLSCYRLTRDELTAAATPPRLTCAEVGIQGPVRQ